MSGSSYVFVAEVARFLRVEDRVVRRWIRMDGLPETRVPTRTKTVPRIYLPDLHGWLVARTGCPGEKLMSYEDFLLEFERSREAAKAEGRAA